MLCLSLWCSGAGQVLADNVLSLHSVDKLSIYDINPVPVLRLLSQNAEHCSMSTLGIALDEDPELVRCVIGSMQHFTHSVPLKSHLYTVCVVLFYHMSHCGR